MAHRKNTTSTPDHAPFGELSIEDNPQSTTPKRPRACIYARVSLPKQKTVREQIEMARQRAKERGWDIRYILSDQGLRGSDDTRPGFQRVLDLVEARRIDVLIVWKFDRAARSLKHASSLVEFLTEHDVAIHSITEPIDSTTPMGRFILGNLANVAELEQHIIKERAQMGQHRSAREGRWPRPHVPFGYRRTKGNHLRIHHEEGKQIKAAFQAYIDKGSHSEAAHEMNRSGISFRGEKWNAIRVRKVIDNPIYRGTIKVGGFEGHHPDLAIIDAAIFNKVEETKRLKQRSGKPASQTAREESIERVFEQYLASLKD